MQEGKPDVQQLKHQVQAAVAAPPSASSSPSHEFSFAVSVVHPPAAAKAREGKARSSPPALDAAIDLSPADEIFFHGHLLPLHLLSHLPISPRSSTNSLDSFTLPIKELSSRNDDDGYSSGVVDSGGEDDERGRRRHVPEGKGRGKSKSFSLFAAMPKWRKLGQERDDGGGGDRRRQKRESKFELLKRYVRFVKPFLSLRSRRRGSSDEFLRQPPYSYSGNLRVREKKSFMRGRRGEFSAPATMRTSPANSGLLVASGAATPTSSAKSDSTMEELQAAIQAAIAHCKKSIADDKIKLQP